jgi:hypothetical protein
VPRGCRAGGAEVEHLDGIEGGEVDLLVMEADNRTNEELRLSIDLISVKNET